jgi:hypothetical protein
VGVNIELEGNTRVGYNKYQPKLKTSKEPDFFLTFAMVLKMGSIDHFTILV